MWAKHEDVALVECLHILAEDPHWKADNGTFRTERATRTSAKTIADAVEDLDVQDNTFINEFVEQEGVKDSESREDVGASTCQTSDDVVPIHTMKKIASKKRSRSDDGLSDLVKEIGKFGAAYRETAKEIKEIIGLFKKEAEGNDRRMSIFTEIMKIEGLSNDEMLIAGEHISKDAHKVDFFFSLPNEFKKDYVIKQLVDCHSYQPSFDFGPSRDM
ncbi:hypothetical protein V6N11_081692 [Hibiscus sabdariffa]|uniref:No apical meristem-associated C-terminal domain-containing protein n=1 Tax=Hibiscus sabdariffa TaxID=183260 RepID=A0ABR2Q6Y1_9ROSI